jgi:hypothetical protein
MSQHHNPPRQNVHRLRKPVTAHTAPKQFRSGLSHSNKANAKFNAESKRANAAGAVATAGQLVGAGVKLN